MKGFYPALTQILKKHGFVFSRQGRGGHEIWSNGKLVVTLDRGCKSRFTAEKILKQAGIKEKL